MREGMNELYLFTTHGDGAFSTVVKGLEGVYELLIESTYGSIDSVLPDDLISLRRKLFDEDEWTDSCDFGRWSWHMPFEDGGIFIQRITDASAASFEGLHRILRVNEELFNQLRKAELKGDKLEDECVHLEHAADAEADRVNELTAQNKVLRHYRELVVKHVAKFNDPAATGFACDMVAEFVTDFVKLDLGPEPVRKWRSLEESKDCVIIAARTMGPHRQSMFLKAALADLDAAEKGAA